MRKRCVNPNDISYKNYGGRGIKICGRWEKFENFYEDMGDSPVGLSLDRINNDGNYSKKNCRWATRTQQANNRRDNRSAGKKAWLTRIKNERFHAKQTAI